MKVQPLLVLLVMLTITINIYGKEPPLQAEKLFSLPNVAAPEFATKGPHSVGVKTFKAINPDQLVIPADNQLVMPLKKADRELTLEAWYPAKYSKDKSLATYKNETQGGDSFIIQGEAFQNAIPAEGVYPLVIISHGLTGYRTYQYHLAEHLASHGYIVVSIDHTGFTIEEANASGIEFHGFNTAVIHQSRDQQFILDYLADKQHFLTGHIDTEKAALLAHSFGGRATINTIGGCTNFTPENLQALGFPVEAAQSLPPLFNTCAGGKTATTETDKRWKAAIPMSPWGAQFGLFNLQDVASIAVPTLLITGNIDEIVGYENGVKTLYDAMSQEDRYMLVYQNARHNIAGHPPLKISGRSTEEYERYAEGAWNVEVLAGINKHFSTVFFNCYVKDIKEHCEYLNLPFLANQMPGDDGKLREPWKGFPNRLSVGMEWHH